MRTIRPDDSLNDIFQYYLDLGTLFEEMSEHSGYLNFGYLDEGQRTADVSFAQKELIRKVAEAGEFGRGMRVLDVGCGLGGPAQQVSEDFGCTVTGVDPGPFQRERLRKRMRKLSVESAFSPVAGDAHELPFRSRSVDRIYSVESAFHYADKLKFIRECARVIRSGGLLIIADILRKPGRRGRSWPARTLERALAAPQIFDMKRYAEAAEEAGLKLVRAEDISPGVRRAMRLWRRNFYHRWPSVRKRYSVVTLIKIGLALALTPDLATLAPFHYVILVLEFNKNVS